MVSINRFARKVCGSVSVIFAVTLPIIFIVTAASVNITYLQNIQRKTQSSLNVVCTNIRDYIQLSRNGWRIEGSDRAFGSLLDLYKIRNFLNFNRGEVEEGKEAEAEALEVAKIGKLIFDTVKEINGLGADATFQYHAGRGLERDHVKDFFLTEGLSSDRGQQYDGYGAESVISANIALNYPLDFGLASDTLEVKVDCPIKELQHVIIFHEDFEFLGNYFPQNQNSLFSDISTLNPDDPDNLGNPILMFHLQQKDKYLWSGYNFRVIATQAAQGNFSIELDQTNTSEVEYFFRDAQNVVNRVGAGKARIYRNFELLSGKYILEFKKYSSISNLAASRIDVYLDATEQTLALSTIVLTATNSVHNSWETFTYEFTIDQTGYHTLGFEAPVGSSNGYLDEITLTTIE